MKRGLVMSGGASKGAFTQGVLVELARHGEEYRFISGVSVGALEAGLISQYPIGQFQDAVDALDDIWLGLNGDKSIYKSWLLGTLAGLINRDGFTNSKPLWNIIQSHVNDQAARESGREIRIGTCSYGKGLYVEKDQNTPDLWKWVAASSGYSPFLLPIWIDGDLWFDGGYRCVTPLKSAIKAGCEEIDVVLTGPPKTAGEDPRDNWLGTKINAYHVGMRVVGLMADEVFYRDAMYAEAMNHLIDAGHPSVAGKKKIKVRLFMPERILPGGGLSFDPQLIRDRRDEGIQVAQKILGA
jgi:predicted acylesterase/phospholipase RssA